VADLLDRVYDTLTQGAAVVGTALGVDMSDVVVPAATAASEPRGAPFRVEEVIDGETGAKAFVVTDGAGTSCDAPTRALAEATLDALEGRRAMVIRTGTGTKTRTGTGTKTGTEQGK
jgi:hypothetical protein